MVVTVNLVTLLACTNKTERTTPVFKTGDGRNWTAMYKHGTAGSRKFRLYHVLENGKLDEHHCHTQEFWLALDLVAYLEGCAATK